LNDYVWLGINRVTHGKYQALMRNWIHEDHKEKVVFDLKNIIELYGSLGDSERVEKLILCLESSDIELVAAASGRDCVDVYAAFSGATVKKVKGKGIGINHLSDRLFMFGDSLFDLTNERLFYGSAISLVELKTNEQINVKIKDLAKNIFSR